ncbi:hypothetical protein FRC07_010694 [Ceratobasidium sp. 392]|nr:hypothetical protein FRC07_010694 [Ceratobasidium sp. 392]
MGTDDSISIFVAPKALLSSTTSFMFRATSRFVPGDSDAEVDASTFERVSEPDAVDRVTVHPPKVSAVGLVESTNGKEWLVSVATYDRNSRSQKSFKTEVQVPLTGRFGNLRVPAKGVMVSVRGTLAGVSESDAAIINLEVVTFFSLANLHRPPVNPRGASGSDWGNSSGPASVGRTKGEHRKELVEAPPAKKIRVGPLSMFLNDTEPAESTGQPGTNIQSSSEEPVSGGSSA